MRKSHIVLPPLPPPDPSPLAADDDKEEEDTVLFLLALLSASLAAEDEADEAATVQEGAPCGGMLPFVHRPSNPRDGGGGGGGSNGIVGQCPPPYCTAGTSSGSGTVGWGGRILRINGGWRGTNACPWSERCALRLGGRLRPHRLFFLLLQIYASTQFQCEVSPKY